MQFDPNPSAVELAHREQALRDEIAAMTRNRRPTRDVPATAPGVDWREPSQQAASVRTLVTDESPGALDLSPETAAILGINLSSGQVLSTLGKFDLSDLEMAQIATFAVQAVQRNLQAMLTAMEEKHGVRRLADAVVQAQQELAREAAKEAAGQPIRVIEHATRPGQKLPPEVDAQVDHFISGMSEPAPRVNAVGDDIDEENDLPPTPMNRRIPRRKK